MMLDVYYKLAAINKVRSFADLSPLSVPDGYKDTGGNLRSSLYNFLAYSRPYEGNLSQTSTSSNWNIVIGGGTTPVTQDDYMLESQITVLSFLHLRAVYSTSEKYIRFEKTYKNNTQNPVTVSEIGVTARASYASSSYCQVLIYREVLAEPIIVQPGEPVAIHITVKVAES